MLVKTASASCNAALFHESCGATLKPKTAASLRIQRNTDLQRELTKRGHKQAEKTGQLAAPSPAGRHARAREPRGPHTADRTRPHRTFPDAARARAWRRCERDPRCIGLAVEYEPAAGRPSAGLGRLASLLIAGTEMDWSVKKAGVWWLCRRMREDFSTDRAARGSPRSRVTHHVGHSIATQNSRNGHG